MHSSTFFFSFFDDQRQNYSWNIISNSFFSSFTFIFFLSLLLLLLLLILVHSVIFSRFTGTHRIFPVCVCDLVSDILVVLPIFEFLSHVPKWQREEKKNAKKFWTMRFFFLYIEENANKQVQPKELRILSNKKENWKTD